VIAKSGFPSSCEGVFKNIDSEGFGNLLSAPQVILMGKQAVLGISLLRYIVSGVTCIGITWDDYQKCSSLGLAQTY